MLINNAGIADARGVAAEQFDTATFNQIISVDLLGAFLYAGVWAAMLERGKGSIVNICSIMASGGNENNVIGYTAAKAGYSISPIN